MATEEETTAKLKKLFNDVLDERDAKKEEAARKKAEEDAKNNPPKKGFLDTLLGG